MICGCKRRVPVVYIKYGLAFGTDNYALVRGTPSCSVFGGTRRFVGLDFCLRRLSQATRLSWESFLGRFKALAGYGQHGHGSGCPRLLSSMQTFIALSLARFCVLELHLPYIITVIILLSRGILFFRGSLSELLVCRATHLE